MKPKKSGLFRRLTNKLKPPAAATLSALPKSPTVGSFPRAGPAPSLSNDLVAKERRQAALRERGLLPPDLSQLEKEQDQRYTTVVEQPLQSPDGESAARKIQQDWIAKNNVSAPEDADTGPAKAAYPRMLSKPDFSKARPTVDAQAEVDTIEEEPEASAATLVDHPARTDSPLATEDPVPLTNDATGLSQDALRDEHLFHSPNSSVLLPDPRLLASKRPRPIGITTTIPHRSPSNSSQFANRSVSSPNVPSTKQPSLSTKTSLPALSPTKSASSCSSVDTPPQHVGDIDAVVVAPSPSGRSATSVIKPELFKIEVNTVHFSAAEAEEAFDEVVAPNPEDSGGFEAFVERRERRRHRRQSTGVVDPKHASISSNRLSGDFTTRSSKSTEMTVRAIPCFIHSSSTYLFIRLPPLHL